MTRPSPRNPANSPLGRFLTHPGQMLADLAHHALAAARTYGPWAGPVLLAAALLAWAAHQRLARRRHARLADGARHVTILPPPQVDRAGAEAMWGHLTGLLRPAWKRLTTGQPHLCWEYSWSRAGISIGLWVPGTVPPGTAERAGAGRLARRLHHDPPGHRAASRHRGRRLRGAAAGAARTAAAEDR